MNIQIREAGLHDAKLISVLATASFYEAYYEQDDPHDLANYVVESFDIDVVRQQMTDGLSKFFIAYVNDRAIGYARLIDGSREPCISGIHTIELKRIYIVERLWRQGVGEALLDHCIGEARRLGKDSIWLGVWERNSRARPFYEKHGFIKVGRLEFPYGDSVGINDVMERTL